MLPPIAQITNGHDQHDEAAEKIDRSNARDSALFG